MDDVTTGSKAVVLSQPHLSLEDKHGILDLCMYVYRTAV